MIFKEIDNMKDVEDICHYYLSSKMFQSKVHCSVSYLVADIGDNYRTTRMRR